MTTVKCSICGAEMECPESMLVATIHVCPNCIENVPDPRLQSFLIDAQSALDELADEFKQKTKMSKDAS